MKTKTKVTTVIAEGTPGLKRLLSDNSIARSYDFHRLKGSLAAQVKRARGVLGITQTELARRIETSQPEIVKLEKGQAPNGPTLHTIEKLAEALEGEFDVRIVGRSARAGRISGRRHGKRRRKAEIHGLFTARKSGTPRIRSRKARLLARGESFNESEN